MHPLPDHGSTNTEPEAAATGSHLRYGKNLYVECHQRKLLAFDGVEREATQTRSLPSLCENWNQQIMLEPASVLAGVGP